MKLSDKLKTVKLSDIKPYRNNPKEHTDEQIKLIKNSIEKHTYIQPIAVDKKNEIVIGHGRYFALNEINQKMEIEVIDLSHLSSKEIKKLRILDNKSNESEWIFSSLAKELDSIYKKSKIDSINIDEVGLSSREIDEILSKLRGDGKEDIEDEVPEMPECLVIKGGDLIELGKHRLMCGDTEKKEDVKKLKSKKDCIILTSPPYNIGRFGFKGSNKYHNSKDNIKNYFEFLKNFINNSFEISSHVFLNISINWNNLNDVISLFNEYKDKICDIMIWVKDTSMPIPGNRHNVLNSDYEFVIIFDKNKNKKGRSIYIDKEFRNVSNVIRCKRNHRNEYAKIHKAVYTVNFAETILNIFTTNSIGIIDLFLGSGLTLIACEKTGRICYGMEIDRHYCSVIIERYCQYTNKWKIKINGKEVSWRKYKIQNNKNKK